MRKLALLTSVLALGLLGCSGGESAEPETPAPALTSPETPPPTAPANEPPPNPNEPTK